MGDGAVTRRREWRASVRALVEEPGSNAESALRELAVVPAVVCAPVEVIGSPIVVRSEELNARTHVRGSTETINSLRPPSLESCITVGRLAVPWVARSSIRLQ